MRENVNIRTLQLVTLATLILFGACDSTSTDAGLNNENPDPPTTEEGIRYVSPSGRDMEMNHCGDPDDPCLTVQYAIDQSNEGDTVWVATGEYTESLMIDKNLMITGEDMNETILQADPQPQMVEQRVITISGEPVVEIRNVTVRHGGRDTDPGFSGGGLHTATNELTLVNVTFSKNAAASGGGVYVAQGSHINQGNSPVFQNVIFNENKAISGGGMYYENNGSPVLTNVLFYGNEAQAIGGGMYIDSDVTAELTNTTFAANDALSPGSFPGPGDGMFTSGDPVLVNTLMWGNSEYPISGGSPDISYSLIEGGCPEGAVCTHLLTQDPQFLDLSTGDVRLSFGSPAVDAGDPNTDLSTFMVHDNIFREHDDGIPVDLDGNPRSRRTTIDLGAYELQSEEETSFSGSWHDAGLESNEAHKIQISGQSIFVSTEEDLYHSPLSMSPNWTPLGLNQVMEEGESARDFIAFSDTEILGGVDPNYSGSSPEYWEAYIPFYYTSDGGQTWEPVENEFSENDAFFGILTATPDLDTLYAANNGLLNVFRSTDRGQSWTVIYQWNHSGSDGDPWVRTTGDDFMFILDQHHTNQFWAGWHTPINESVIHNSNNRSESWTFDQQDEWKNITPNNVFSTSDVVSHPLQPSTAMAGLSGIRVTTDFGDSWETVLEKGGTTLANSLSDTETVFASGVHESSKLQFSITPNFGKTWQTFIYEDGPDTGHSVFHGVYDMAVAEINGQEVIFVGTSEGLFLFQLD